MLENLKKQIADDLFYSSALEASMEQIVNDDDDIKDTMLNDPDALVIGAEDDPEIEKLVDKLPDTMFEDDEVTDSQIENLAEEFIPESIC